MTAAQFAGLPKTVTSTTVPVFIGNYTHAFKLVRPEAPIQVCLAKAVAEGFKFRRFERHILRVRHTNELQRDAVVLAVDVIDNPEVHGLQSEDLTAPA